MSNIKNRNWRRGQEDHETGTPSGTPRTFAFIIELKFGMVKIAIRVLLKKYK